MRRTLPLAIVVIALVTPAAAATNLLSNGGFDSNYSGWYIGAYPDGPNPVTPAWQPLDALRSVDSGSLAVTHAGTYAPGSISPAIMSQCVTVTPGSRYDFGAKFWVPNPGDGTTRPFTWVWFFSSADCSGSFTLSETNSSLPYDAANRRRNDFMTGSNRNIVAPSNARSARVDIGAWMFPPAFTTIPFTVYFDDVIFAPAGGCVPDEKTACFEDGRFMLTAVFEYEAPNFRREQANVVQLTRDTAYLWFFTPANLEVTAKIYDACPFFNQQWIFLAGMTNLRVEVSVTDLSTSTKKVYVNPKGNTFTPVLDTSTFGCP